MKQKRLLWQANIAFWGVAWLLPIWQWSPVVGILGAILVALLITGQVAWHRKGHPSALLPFAAGAFIIGTAFPAFCGLWVIMLIAITHPLGHMPDWGKMYSGWWSSFAGVQPRDEE